MKRFIYCGIIALFVVIMFTAAGTVFAQPALPTPPARPVPWGSMPLIATGCAVYALWRLRNRD